MNLIRNNKILLIIIIISIIFRFSWFTTHIERDEGTFGYTAWRWLEGNRPYEETYDNKPPLVYVFYGTFVKTFGNTIVPIRIFNNLLFLFSIIIMYKLTNLWYGKKIALLSSAFYGFFMNIPVFEAYFVYTESLLVPLVIFSVYLFWQYYKSHNRIFLFLSILIMFITIGFKQTSLVGLFLIFLIILILKRNSRERFIGLIYFFVVLAISIVATWIILSKHISIYYFFNRVLSSLNDYFVYKANLSYYLAILKEGITLFILTLIGLPIVIRRKKYQDLILVYWFILFLIVSIMPPSFGHYYIHIIPQASILSSIGLYGLIYSKINYKKYYILIIGIIALISFSFMVKHYYEDNFRSDLMMFDGGNSYKEQIQVADFIKKNTNENDSVLVWDHSVTLYWLSERKSIRELNNRFRERLNCNILYNWYTANNVSFDTIINRDILYVIHNFMEFKYIIFYPKYPRTCIQFDNEKYFSDFTDNESMTKINQVEIYPIRNLTFNDLAYYCSAINSSEVKDECYLRLAQKSNNLTYCNPILNETIKQNCLKESTNQTP